MSELEGTPPPKRDVPVGRRGDAPFNAVGPCTPQVAEEHLSCDLFYGFILPAYNDVVSRNVALVAAAADLTKRIEAHNIKVRLWKAELDDYNFYCDVYLAQLLPYEQAAAHAASEALWEQYGYLCGDQAGLVALAEILTLAWLELFDEADGILNDMDDFNTQLTGFLAARKDVLAQIRKYLSTLICTRCREVDALSYQLQLLKSSWTFPQLMPADDPIVVPPAPNPPGSGQPLPPPPNPPPPPKPEPVPPMTYSAAMRFAGIDWENEITSALPLQFVRVVVDQSFPGAALATVDLGGDCGVSLWVVGGNHYQSIDLPLTQVAPNSTLWVTDLVLISADGADRSAVYELPGCPGEQFYARLQGNPGSSGVALSIDATLDIGEPLENFEFSPCMAATALPEVTLEAVSPVNVSIDPQAMPKGVQPNDTGLKVRVLDHDGQPIENEPVIWRILELDQSFDTLTDKDGIARLDFVLAPLGHFHPVIDNLVVSVEDNGAQVPMVLTEGTYHFDAIAEYSLSAILMTTDPVRFEVDLVKPTTLRFVSLDGSPLNEVWVNQDVRIQIFLGRADAAAQQSGKDIAVTVSSTTGDTIQLMAKPYYLQGSVYQTPRFIIKDKHAFAGGGYMPIDDGGTLTAKALGAGVAVPGFEAQLTRTLADAQRLLHSLNDGLNAVVTNPSGVAPLRLPMIIMKSKMAANAIAWLPEPFPTGAHKLAVCQAYIGLLGQERDFGAPIAHAAATAGVPSSLKHTAIVFACQPEQDAVIAALNTATVDVLIAYAKASTVFFTFMGKAVKAFASMFSSIDKFSDALASPLFGGYTAITGNTVDGNEAILLERVAGGVEALAAILPAPGIGSLPTRLLGTARMAIAVGSRIAVLGPLAVLESAIAAVFTGVVSVVVAVDKVRKALIAVGRTDRVALKFLSEAEQALLLGEDLLIKRDAMARKYEDIRRQLAATTGLERGELQTSLLALEKEMTQVEAAANNFWKKAQASLQAMAEHVGKCISPDEALAELRANPNWAPTPHQWINGRPAHLHFERQVQAMLEARGWAKGKGVKLNTAYYTPLFTGPVANRPKYFGQIKAPRMDHMQVGTIHVADSKYYFFEGAVRVDSQGVEVLTKRGEQAVAEIADTLEKGRLVQGQQLFGKKGSVNLLGITTKEEQLLTELLKREITIYTPVQPPAPIVAAIRKRIGARSAARVKLEVLKPDVVNWLKAPRPS